MCPTTLTLLKSACLGSDPVSLQLIFHFSLPRWFWLSWNTLAFLESQSWQKGCVPNPETQQSSTLECHALLHWHCISRCPPGLTSLCFHPLQNTQRISSSQSTQPLATPVVSVTTPSLPPQGLVYSAMPTAYNTGKGGLGSGLGLPPGNSHFWDTWLCFPPQFNWRLLLIKTEPVAIPLGAGVSHV